MKPEPQTAQHDLTLDAAAWDVFARHQPYYHILSDPMMLDPDAAAQAEFWAAGERDVAMLAEFGGLAANAQLAVDFGCGLGRLARALRTLSRHVIALDISAEMLRQAREQNGAFPQLEFRQLTSERWPIDTASCDVVISLHVLQHQSSARLMAASLAEIGRVLRPGGRAVFNIPLTTVTGGALVRLRQVFRSRRSVAALEQKLRDGSAAGKPAFTEQEIMGEMFQLDCRRMKGLSRWRFHRALRGASLRVLREEWSLAMATLVAVEKV